MKYIIDYTSNYKKQRKKLIKQGKDISKDNKYYTNCYECHITPDWLLVYKLQDSELIITTFCYWQPFRII